MGRKPKDSGEKASSNGVWGKSVSKEKSVYATLKEITGTDMKAYYIMFLYCPEYLKEADKRPVKDFEDLKSRYKCFSDDITEEVCKRYIMEQGCQTAVKWLLKRLHQKKMIELYDKYYKKAMDGDVQAFKAWQEFSEKFFREDRENGLTRLLNKIPDDELENDRENFSYAFEY